MKINLIDFRKYLYENGVKDNVLLWTHAIDIFGKGKINLSIMKIDNKKINFDKE